MYVWQRLIILDIHFISIDVTVYNVLLYVQQMFFQIM